MLHAIESWESLAYISVFGHCHTLHLLHALSRNQDRFYDLSESSAAADITDNPIHHLVPRRVGILIQQCFRSHDHAWRAETALGAVVLGKSHLERVWLFSCANPLDRSDLAPFNGQCQDQAGVDRFAVQDDGTS